jgi:hypothetical protein
MPSITIFDMRVSPRSGDIIRLQLDPRYVRTGRRFLHERGIQEKLSAWSNPLLELLNDASLKISIALGLWTTGEPISLLEIITVQLRSLL